MALDKARIEIYEGGEGQQKGKWRWRFKATNGEIVAQGEAYTTVAGLMNGLNSVNRAILSGDYEVVEIDEPTCSGQ